MNTQVVAMHAGEQPSISEWNASVFLAGPMPREVSVPSWRPAMLKAIQDAWTGPGTLAVFVPEARNWQPYKYDHHTWEDHWQSIVDVIVFWVPRDMQRLPGMNTNIEFGRWESCGRLVFGAPPEATGVAYLRECAARVDAPVTDIIEETVSAAMKMIGEGVLRAGGQRDIPLLLWRSPAFQRWLKTFTAQGKTLAGGRVLWAYELLEGVPQFWALRADVADASASQEQVVVIGNPRGVIVAQSLAPGLPRL